MDRCRQERLAALRRLIEDAEASGISECNAEEVFAKARALSDERAARRGRRSTGAAACGRLAAQRVEVVFGCFGRARTDYMVLDGLVACRH